MLSFIARGTPWRAARLFLPSSSLALARDMPLVPLKRVMNAFSCSSYASAFLSSRATVSSQEVSSRRSASW